MRIFEDFFDDIESREETDDVEVSKRDLSTDKNAVYISWSLADDSAKSLTSGEGKNFIKKKLENVLSHSRNIIEFSEPVLEKDTGRFYNYGFGFYIIHKMRSLEEVMRLFSSLSSAIKEYRRTFVYVRSNDEKSEHKLYFANHYNEFFDKSIDDDNKLSVYYELLLLCQIFLPGNKRAIEDSLNIVDGREEVYKRVIAKFMRGAKDLKLLKPETLLYMQEGKIQIPEKDSNVKLYHINADEIYNDDKSVTTELRRIFPMFNVIREKYNGTKVSDISIMRSLKKDEVKLYALIWVGVDYVFKQDMPDCIVMCVEQYIWGGQAGYQNQVRSFFDSLNSALGGGLPESVYEDILNNFKTQKIGKVTIEEYFA